MRRAAKRAKPKVKAKPPVARKSLKSADPRARDLQKHLAEALKREAEALEQQTATAEILKVISSSPTDFQPVFDTIVRNAARLCEVFDAALVLADGDEYVQRAHYGPIEAVRGERHPLRGTVGGRAILEARVIQVENLAEASDYPAGRALAQRIGYRTVLLVPLLRAGAAIGAIGIRRTEVLPFSDKQIELLKTFADQAVIAIENVRLFKELEARNRELTASSQILQVISSSPTDVQPVFDAIARNAAQVCGGTLAAVHLLSDEWREDVARYNYPPNAPAPRVHVNEIPNATRVIREGTVFHLSDVESDPRVTPAALRRMRAIGTRAYLAVPMKRGATPIGSISVGRHEPGAFSEQHIELLKTFADQAVIAIENVRLFNETKEALERQTATSEILRVISSSPTDTQPVFDAIVQSAVTLCGAILGAIYRREGDLVHVVGLDRRYPEAEEVRAAYPAPVTSALMSCRAIHENAIIHSPDTETAGVLPPEGLRLARLSGFRSVVAVPMRREGDPIGAILVGRPAVGPFPDEQIALLQTFADQAVIAIENVRLFTELEARNTELTATLDRQVATGEVLRAISQAQTDAQPVFEIIAASARRLCGAAYAQVQLCDGDQIHLAALDSVNPEGDAAILAVYPLRVGDGSAGGRAIETRTVAQIPDLIDDRAYRFSGVWEASGLRSLLAVPMLREGVPIGTIGVGRAEPGAFPQTQIDLLQTFADQAVIAIENVRLFTELQTSNRELTTALETQTATSDILRVISRSQTDVQPVFDAIVASAVRLLGAHSGVLTRIVGDQIEVAALTSHDAVAAAALGGLFPQPLRSEAAHAQAIRDRAPVNIADIADAYPDPRRRDAARDYARVSGSRSLVVVPMLRLDEAIGSIGVTRREPGGFTDDEIALLKTFTDQAVIAVENVRLFNELEGRNRDLTATSEILRVISSSPTDVQPVFDTIVRSAVRLCDGFFGALYQFDGELIQRVAHHNYTPEALEASDRVYPARPTRALGTGRAILERAMVHIPDVEVDPEYRHLELARAIGYRSLLNVPMLREGAPIGVIAVTRAEPGPFSDNEIELLKTFADQAVIAVENVRLFKELEARNHDLTEALDQQTATSEILGVISSSPTDAQPVFESLVASAARLCGANDLLLLVREGDVLRPAAGIGSFWRSLAADFRVPLERGSVAARSVIDGTTLHFPDLAALSEAEFPAGRDLQRRFGHRTVLVVPLVREGSALGTIFALRFEVRPFADQQVALLKTFADQAVIAIENVRLFTELEGRNRDLTATSEILRVISSSPTNVEPVFDTIIRSAVRLCDGLYGSAVRFDGEMMHLAAGYNYTSEVRQALEEAFPMRPDRRMMAGRAILSRTVIQVEDALEDPEYAQDVARAGGFRSMLAVPMMREGNPIGAIVVNRGQPGSFSVSQIDLLKTFADQAVIAVENVRLFKELEARTGELTQSVEKLTALGEVSRAVTSTLDVETVLDTIVSRASQLAGADGCSIFEYDAAAQQFELRATHNDDTEFVAALRAVPLRKGEGLMGRAAEMREPIQIPDITQPGAYESSVRDTLVRFGYRALLAVPLLREDQIIGSLSFNRKAPGEFTPEVVEVLKTFATQSALAIQNARLFREIADKSAQLEAASRHKSEFLANMSHELRTPLNAIIGFSEVLTERMFGELNDKQDEYLKDIHASGQHLLSLINDILDLSKIEAGRMELERSDFDLPNAIENALILVRERASRRGIKLGSTIDERLGVISGDERKVKQVLLNLLSNALKFTPEGGRIEAGARLYDGVAEVSVADTGVGIAPEDQEAVFEEFRQVGTADKKAEGTGLGLALSRKFIELHGGRIWVESEVGKGSTFRFTLPLRIEQQRP